MLRIAAFAFALLFAGAASAQWYVEGNIGPSFFADSDWTDTGPGVSAAGEVTFDTGLMASGAIGMHLTSNLRVEGEVSWRQADLDEFSVTSLQGVAVGGTANADGEASALGFMLNGWYDFNTGTPWVPFVGGGVGLAEVSAEIDSVGGVATSFDESETVFAYQFGGGVAYRFTPNLALTLSYRYFATEDPEFESGAFTDEAEFSSHTVAVGGRVQF